MIALATLAQSKTFNLFKYCLKEWQKIDFQGQDKLCFCGVNDITKEEEQDLIRYCKKLGFNLITIRVDDEKYNSFTWSDESKDSYGTMVLRVSLVRECIRQKILNVKEPEITEVLWIDSDVAQDKNDIYVQLKKHLNEYEICSAFTPRRHDGKIMAGELGVESNPSTFKPGVNEITMNGMSFTLHKKDLLEKCGWNHYYTDYRQFRMMLCDTGITPGHLSEDCWFYWQNQLNFGKNMATTDALGRHYHSDGSYWVHYISNYATLESEFNNSGEKGHIFTNTTEQEISLKEYKIRVPAGHEYECSKDIKAYLERELNQKKGSLDAWKINQIAQIAFTR